MTEAVQYIQTGKAFFDENRQREVVQISITPQKHEIIYEPRFDHNSPYRPEQQRFMELFDMLRGTARNAYMSVLAAGLTALNKGQPIPEEELKRHFEIESENLLVRIGEVEKERDRWKQLAEDRKIEIRVLERVLRPAS